MSIQKIGKILLITITLAILLQPTWVKTQSQQIQSRSYTDTRFGFSFYYPEELTYFNYAPVADIISTTSFYPTYVSPDIPYPPEISVTVFDNLGAKSLTEWVASRTVNGHKLESDAISGAVMFQDAIAPVALTIDEQSALIFRHFVMDFVSTRLVFQKGNYILSISYIDNSKRLEEAYISIISSLKFNITGQSERDLEEERTLTAFVRNLDTPVPHASEAPITPKDNEYRLPWVNDVEYRVTQGWNSNYSHLGIAKYAYDFGMPEGREVRASKSGIVASAEGGFTNCGGQEFANYGNRVVINHSDNTATLYLHMQSVSVSAGNSVQRGAKVGNSGKTGWTANSQGVCGPHLHFQRQEQGSWWKQSVQVYFDEYPGQELYSNIYYKSQNNSGSIIVTPTPTSSGSDSVILYNQTNYQGSEVFNKGTGFYNDPNANSYSMKIPGGWSVKTWRGDNKGGEERCWTSSISNLQDHGWQLAIQSIEIFNYNACPQNATPTPAPINSVWVCQSDNAQSNCQELTSTGITDWGGTGWNDTIRSVKVPGGKSIFVFDDDKLRGTAECYSGDRAPLPDTEPWALRGRVTSVQVFNQSSCPTAQLQSVVLYNLESYGDFHFGMGNLVGLFNLEGYRNDATESIRIPTGLSARVYEHANGEGEASNCLTGDVWSFGSLKNRVSSVQVYTNTTCTLPDTTKPTGSITYPLQDNQLRGPIIPLKVNASDDSSGIKSVEYYAWSVASWSNQTWIHLTTDTTSPYQYDWDVSGITESSTVYLAINIKDNAGNFYDIPWLTFEMDKHTPSSAVNPLAAVQTTSDFTVTWNGSDNFTSAELLTYDVQYQIGCTGNWNDWIIMETINGATFFGDYGQTYCFRSRAYDLASNTEPFPATADTSTTVQINPTVIPSPTATDTLPVTPTPTGTSGSTAVATPTETPTATPTPTGGDLLVNGGFEDALNSWTLKNTSGEKFKCNSLNKQVAHSGSCAFQFKGGTGENSQLQQQLSLAGKTFAAGEWLDLNLYLKAPKPGASGKVKVVVQYSDGTASGKRSLNLAQTDGYELLTTNYSLLSGAVSKIKLQIKHTSLSGKLYIDDLSLMHSVGGAVSARTLPLP